MQRKKKLYTIFEQQNNTTPPNEKKTLFGVLLYLHFLLILWMLNYSYLLFTFWKKKQSYKKH